MKEIPYFRLSSFYLFYFATLGVVVPYFGEYLKSNGFLEIQIGVIFFFLNLTKIIAPYIWGAIADSKGERMGIIRVAAFLAVLIFSTILCKPAFALMIVITVAFSFFWNAALPQFEAVTLNYLHKDSNRYSQIRLWGSVGFIITVITAGWLIEKHGIDLVPLIGLAGYAGIFLTTLTVTETKSAKATGTAAPVISIIKTPYMLAFLAAGFLMQFSHGSFYAFFTIFMKEFGHSNHATGYLWAIGVVAEIIVFIFIYKIIPCFGVRKLLLFSYAVAALRWVVTALLPEYVAVIAISQTMHAATFGIHHAVAMKIIHSSFTGKVQGRGQALYTSVCMGAGTASGSLISGLAWDAIGGRGVYLISAIAVLFSYLLANRWVKPNTAYRHSYTTYR